MINLQEQIAIMNFIYGYKKLKNNKYDYNKRNEDKKTRNFVNKYLTPFIYRTLAIRHDEAEIKLISLERTKDLFTDEPCIKVLYSIKGMFEDIKSVYYFKINKLQMKAGIRHYENKKQIRQKNTKNIRYSRTNRQYVKRTNGRKYYGK